MNTPKWLDNAVFYEIYPQSFLDTNADGIGDIKGIISKLEYIKSLGCNAIWMNPCFDSPFNDAGYDVRDYKKIAPRYGTNDDLEELVQKMHELDMHLLLDLVPCHTSDEHEWFKQSCKQERNIYSERYIWTNSAFSKPNNLTAVGGMAPRNGTYVISFFNSQPSLNYGFYKVNEAWQHSIDSKEAIETQNAIIDVMKFWLAKGVDGFRVDMAACLVKNDIDEQGTQMVWKKMFEVIKKEYPNSAFVAEWGHPDRAISCGFDMDFYLDHGWDGGNGYHHLLRDQDFDYDTFEVRNDNSYFKSDSQQTINPFLEEYLNYYNKTKDQGYISLITDNHDMIRTSHFFNKDEIKLIYGFIFTMPGVPFLYYGDEIGMKYLPIPTKEGGYHRTGTRTPMQWDNSLNKGFSTADKEKLYLPVDADENAPNVLDCLNDKNSLIYYVKELLAIRNSNKALQSKNNLEIIYASKTDKLFVYKREEFIIIINPSLKSSEFKIDNIEYDVLFSVGSTNYDGKTMTVSALAFTILKLK